MNAAMFREAFGGSWDVGEREIWGLVEAGNRALKIELLQTSKWRCSVFESGSCVVSTQHDDPILAIREALEQLND